jgi:hypothetical protein
MDMISPTFIPFYRPNLQSAVRKQLFKKNGYVSRNKNLPMTALDNLHPFILDGVLGSMSWKTIGQEFLDSCTTNVRGVWLDESNQSRPDIANGRTVEHSQNLAG